MAEVFHSDFKTETCRSCGRGFGYTICKNCIEKYAKQEAYREAVEEYEKFLLDHGYLDSDVWSEKPTAQERFFKSIQKEEE